MLSLQVKQTIKLENSEPIGCTLLKVIIFENLKQCVIKMLLILQDL